VIPKLNISKVVFGAFVIPWVNRQALARAIWIPFLALAVLSVAIGKLVAPIGLSVTLAIGAGYWLIFAVLAVICHRFVLIGVPSSNGSFSLPLWSKRETRFASLLFLLGCIYILVLLATVFAVASLPEVSKDGGSLLWLKYVVSAPAFYVLARLSLVLPATAVDKPIDFKWAWHQTESNGWRLVLVIGVLPLFLSEGADLLLRSEPTVVETLLFGLLAGVFLVLEIVALSLSYRDLTMNDIA
jgi:hypothetical protein